MKPNLSQKNEVSMIKMKFLLALMALFLPAYALATKTCPPSPCFEDSRFSSKMCEAVSDWVAIGSIENIIHDPQGEPLLKDFASFTFKIKSWEKGADKDLDMIRFKVGWCSNRQELPEDTSGLFRLYGKRYVIDEQSTYEYLYIDRFK
ncbi:hypothetical protein [Sulfuriflexus sp.]|uniref:hypothetical protein n=1 Tax=Sulfuriflexus sp. TaxID=2015443 RepID=UPI0028CEEE64|nr:hypothetical protein [Sulfuriflexus sp.]MDT8405363.1 hypothetical protein [Sulfuriflexus sp.]